MTNFKVPIKDVILSGITTNPSYGQKKFIICISRQPDCKGIWVNTDYRLDDGCTAVTTVGGKPISSFCGYTVSTLSALDDVYSDGEYTLLINNDIVCKIDSAGLIATYHSIQGINKSKTLSL